MPWRLPEKLPPLADLKAGVGALEAQLQPVGRRHAAQCLSKLLVGFNERKTGDESKLLLEVWLEANGDLPDDLWSEGVLDLLRSHKFGMPKPVHLRQAVEDRFAERRRMLQRTQEMLDRAREEPPPPAAFEPEPLVDRVRAMRDSLRRVGQIDRAAVRERELAQLEGREPEEWARDAPQAAGEAAGARLPESSPEGRARLNAALAKRWREQGHTQRADQLEAEAKAAPATDVVPDYDEIPEGDPDIGGMDDA